MAQSSQNFYHERNDTMKYTDEEYEEAQILYGIVNGKQNEGEFHAINGAIQEGWIRLARMVLIDSKAKQEENKPSEKDNKSFQALINIVPDSLTTAPFLEAWSDWLHDRKDRKKIVTVRAAKIQLGKLKAMGEKRAIAAIENSIEKGYQGIFEANQQGKFKKQDDENAVPF